MKNNNNRNQLTGEDKIKNLTESFTYDNLNRLTGSQVAGQDAIILGYEDNGNISSKSDVGEDDYIYNYGENGAGLHAVTSIYHDSGLFLQQDITYTSFNKIATITQGENEMQFTYGTDNLRRKTQLYNNGELIKTKYYVGNYEKEITGSNTRELHYIYGGDGLAAVLEKKGTSKTMYYVSKDYLGSPIMLTKEDGTIAEQYNFDAWGNRRNPTNWSYTNVPTTYLLDRGFTFHEHMDEFGLINMNGRLYDPEIGRMLSPDNNVQMPDFTQNFNRYSYAFNNPLKFTDPGGNSIWNPFSWLTEASNWLSERLSGNNDYKFDMNYVRTGITRNNWRNNPNVVLGANGYPIGYNAFGEMPGQENFFGSDGFTSAALDNGYIEVPIYGWTDIECLGYHVTKYEFLRYQTVKVGQDGGAQLYTKEQLKQTNLQQERLLFLEQI